VTQQNLSENIFTRKFFLRTFTHL